MSQLDDDDAAHPSTRTPPAQMASTAAPTANAPANAAQAAPKPSNANPHLLPLQEVRLHRFRVGVAGLAACG